jgi:hypothetical protein
VSIVVGEYENSGVPLIRIIPQVPSYHEIAVSGMVEGKNDLYFLI